MSDGPASVKSYKLHGMGSNILFADGHVKRFSADYFPSRITRANCYDIMTGQWWNTTSGALAKSIAITP